MGSPITTDVIRHLASLDVETLPSGDRPTSKFSMLQLIERMIELKDVDSLEAVCKAGEACLLDEQSMAAMVRLSEAHDRNLDVLWVSAVSKKNGIPLEELAIHDIVKLQGPTAIACSKAGADLGLMVPHEEEIQVLDWDTGYLKDKQRIPPVPYKLTHVSAAGYSVFMDLPNAAVEMLKCSSKMVTSIPLAMRCDSGKELDLLDVAALMCRPELVQGLRTNSQMNEGIARRSSETLRWCMTHYPNGGQHALAIERLRDESFLGSSPQIRTIGTLLAYGATLPADFWDEPVLVQRDSELSEQGGMPLTLPRRWIFRDGRADGDFLPVAFALAQAFYQSPLLRPVLESLNSQGVDITEPNTHGQTLLHAAVRRADYELYVLAREFGCNPQAKDDEGLTAMDHLAKSLKSLNPASPDYIERADLMARIHAYEAHQAITQSEKTEGALRPL